MWNKTFLHTYNYTKRKLVYQYTMLSPKNKAAKVPVIRKGPNGISDRKPFFCNAIRPTPIIAPTKKARKKAGAIFGQPRNRPMKNASFTSPKPIQRPLDTKKIARKKALADRAAKVGFKSISKFSIFNDQFSINSQ